MKIPSPLILASLFLSFVMLVRAGEVEDFIADQPEYKEFANLKVEGLEKLEGKLVLLVRRKGSGIRRTTVIIIANQYGVVQEAARLSFLTMRGTAEGEIKDGLLNLRDTLTKNVVATIRVETLTGVP